MHGLMNANQFLDNAGVFISDALGRKTGSRAATAVLNKR